MSPLDPVIDELTRGVSLKGHYATLSHRYRFGVNKNLGNNEEHLAYIACRMPATFAACCEVVRRMQEAMPDFSPKSVLDVGSGPATAVLALIEQGILLERAHMVEQDAAFIPIAKRFLQNCIPDLVWSEVPPKEPCDLVISSYMLSELDEETQNKMVTNFMGGSSSCIVLIDTGTPHGYNTLMNARDTLIQQGYTIVAPCPHNKPCPLKSPDWCHFSVRLARSRLHRQLKGAELGYEDEKFCYLIASKTATPARAADRILAHPLKRSGHMHVKLCTHTGELRNEVISKKTQERYQRAKKLDWGDLV